MNDLEKFLAENTVDGGFLQSEHWAKFKKETGAGVFEFGDNKSFRALVIEHKLPLVGKYWFVPRGPIVSAKAEKIRNSKFEAPNKSEILNSKLEKELHNVLSKVLYKAKENKIGWIRVETQRGKDLRKIKNTIEKVKTENPPQSPFSKGGGKIVKAKKNHQPAQVIIMDLAGSEEEILKDMKSKTRYNIRLSQKKGVEVFETRKKEDIEVFCDLLEETAKREKITNHPRRHYHDLLNKIDKNFTKLYIAKYEEKILSGAIVSYYGNVAAYLHGASSDEHRNVMSPFDLHWKIIQDSKARGFEKYDLGGVKLIEKEDKWTPKEGSWQGISRFKLGFCPKCQPVEFPGCWDVILNLAKYRLYKILQAIKDLRK